MLSFFYDPTRVYISVEIKSVTNNSFLSITDSSNDYRSCPNELDFQTVYQDIEEQVTSRGAGKIALKINLKGRLNGKEVQEYFYDLDSFRDFLEHYSLISKQTHAISNDEARHLSLAVAVIADSRTRSDSTNYQFTFVLLGACIAALFFGSYLWLNHSQNQHEEEPVHGYGASL